MRRTATWLAACMAALLALVAMGCKNDPDPVAVERVVLDRTELTITCGDRERLAATVLPENADDKTVTWQSSNTSIARVDYDGTVTAVNEGTATIYARAGGVAATCHVTVNPELAIPESVALSSETLSLTVGNLVVLIPRITWQGFAQDYNMILWQSSNPEVVTVEAGGYVRACAVGTATIYARAGDITAECAVTVTQAFVESITLDYNRLNLKTGQTEKVGATITPKGADDTTILWSSSDETVATVDSDGGRKRHGDYHRTGGRQDGKLWGLRCADIRDEHYAFPSGIQAHARHDTESNGNDNAGQRRRQDDTMVVV